jgi:ubiquinol-cytochrome c reductase cytochrome b subunit
MRRRLRAGVDWIEQRTGLVSLVSETLSHRVPRDSASWWYVFGSAALVTFALQVVTGVSLALVYAPSANDAWASLVALDYDVPLGWFLRALHGWGSNFMVALVVVHLIQVVLFGAYKYPRELTWTVGVFLLLATLGMAFTGQIMRFDQDAYWGLGIGASIAGRTPFIGRELVHLLLGGPIIAGATLSRFFTLHVFVIPGLLLALVGLHLLLVLRLGINEWPMPGRLVRRDTYRAEYEALVAADGVAFFPDAAKRDLVFGGLVVVGLVVCAAVFGPIGPGGQPDPTIIDTQPAPDFFFLWIYAALALLPAYLETPLLLTAPLVGIAALLALPFVAGTGEKSWRRRPMALIVIVMALLTLGTLTALGLRAPWSPVMTAWSALPTPSELMEHRSPLALQGALLVQSKQCRNCHSLGGEGGRRGPALDGVATRLTRDQLVRQVLQGGGEMPAYGKNLRPAEVTALVAFLETLHPAGQPPARDARIPGAPAVP